MKHIKFRPWMDIRNWFILEWYKYIFENKPNWYIVWCRMNGHPHGVVWYTVYGLEPDMHCKDCGENLG